MKRLFSPVLIIFLFFAFSCKKDNPFEKYEGSWSGSYSGDETGSWSASIDDDGNVVGSATSDSLPQLPLNLSGSITEDGVYYAQVAIFFNAPITFQGQLSKNSAVGSWRNDSSKLSGSWSGLKN